ncbi:SDR family oxidoreductase [Nonomuraea africana]|uniref:SDR family oxidoreductase n=1 Tax=Nonomuraea africana TaxID=46171 RepID=UPI0034070EE9
MTVLITGSRGQVGSAVRDRLQSGGHALRAASSRPDGLEVVELMLSKPETFAPALRGVSQVFLYAEPDGVREFVRTAEAEGVEHVVLMSSSAVLAPDAESHPLARTHLLVERALEESGLTVTVLRPGAFAGNALAWSHAIGRGQPVQLAYPDAHVAAVHGDDLADLAYAALTGHRLAGGTYTLSGGESLTFREQLGIIGGLLGREVVVETITRAEAEEQLAAYLPPAAVTALLDLWADSTAGPAPIDDTTMTLLGAPPRTFEQWARENLTAFAAQSALR